MTTVPMTFEELRDKRIKAGISLQEIGDELGRMYGGRPVNKATISRAERGKAPLPRDLSLHDLWTAFERVRARIINPTE